MKKPNLKTIRRLFLLGNLFVITFSGLSGQDNFTRKSPLNTSIPETQESTAIGEIPSRQISTYEEEFDIIITSPADHTDVYGIPGPDTICIPKNRIFKGGHQSFSSTNSMREMESLLEKSPAEMSLDNTSGQFSITENTDYYIGSTGWHDYTLNPPESLPEGAVVTNLIFSVRIDDNGSESSFYPNQYEIMVNAACCYWWNEYYHLGNGHLDGNNDDDDQNDTDIYLENREEHAYNGESADQIFKLRILDDDPATSGCKIDYVQLIVHWEVQLPNLVANETFGGWVAPIETNMDGIHGQASVLYANATTYIATSLNNDSEFDCTEAFFFNVLADGSSIALYSHDQMYSNHPYSRWTEHTFTVGSHTICQIVDPLDGVDETDETDNQYCKTFTWVGPPVAPALSSPSNEATCQPIYFTFSWSSSAYATGYILQVDDNSEYTSMAINMPVSGTSQYVAGLTPNKKYYWRVRGTNPAGNGSFSASRSFTTAPAAPDVPSQNNPATGASCQPTSIILDWNSATGASTYILQVDNNSDFRSTLINQAGLTATEYTASGLGNATTYYWRVRGVNSCNESPWSSVRNFSTTGNPSTPSLSNPSNSATCQPASLTLSWNSVSGASSYDVQVDNNSDFTSPEVNRTDVSGTSASVSGLSQETTYYWLVRAKNSCGNYSSWSGARSFTTAAAAPAAPSQAAPSNGAGCQPTSITLDWNSVSGASSYNVQVDNNDDFGSLLINQDGLTSTEYTASGLSAGTTYYWRVAVENSCGAASSWSSTRNFTTSGTPETPSLSAPSDDATCQSASLTLTWNGVSGAAAYDVEVDNNDDFSSPVASQTDLSGTSASVSGLSSETTYYWIVRAKNSCGVYSSWSSSRSFSTISSAPAAPAPSTPSEGSGCQPLTVTIEWGSVSGATSYSLQVDSNSDFSRPVFDQGSIASTSQPVSGLSEGATYYWRIRAANSCGVESSWSSARNFSTLISSIGTPSLTGPEDNAECQPVNPALSWEGVANATGYSLQVDNNSDFSSPEYSQDCAGTNFNCSGLSESTLYYWKVKATGNCDVTGSWSGVRSFETGSGGMAAPSLTSPANESTGQLLTLTLSWQEVNNATGYWLQFDDNDDFTSPLYNEELTINNKEVSGLLQGTTYFWHVRANGQCSASEWSVMWKLETAALVNVPDDDENHGYYLKQNYPNPFTETTIIEFCIPVSDLVYIEFVDLQGRIVGSYSGYYSAGTHSLKIKPDDEVQAGVYIFRMRTHDFVDTKRCVFR